MNGREFAILLGLLACAISSIIFVVHAQKGATSLRQRRLDALLEALRDPGLDPATKADLLRALANDHLGLLGWVRQKLANPVVWRVLWVSAGWMMLVIAGAALLGHALGVALLREQELPPVIGIAAFGFGMVTLPLAWREVLNRERAVSPR